MDEQTNINTGKEIVEIVNKPVLPQKISKNTVEHHGMLEKVIQITEVETRIFV